MPPVSLPANAAPTITEYHVTPASADIDKDQMQIPWFDQMTTALANESEPDLVDMNVPWSAHFDNSQVSVPNPPAIIALRPLFRDGAHSSAMVKHGMNITPSNRSRFVSIQTRYQCSQLISHYTLSPRKSSGHGQMSMGKDDMLY